MGRPDWCPQGVWDEATGWTEAMYSVQATGLADKWTPVPIIARAILAEREACASVADRYTDHIDIAHFIRNRGNS